MLVILGAPEICLPLPSLGLQMEPCLALDVGTGDATQVLVVNQQVLDWLELSPISPVQFQLFQNVPITRTSHRGRLLCRILKADHN